MFWHVKNHYNEWKHGNRQLEVEGQIASDWVATRQSEYNQLRQSGKDIRLDFSAVTFVDAKGVAMLKNLLTRNVRITRSSELIQSLLCEEELPWFALVSITSLTPWLKKGARRKTGNTNAYDLCRRAGHDQVSSPPENSTIEP